MPLGLARGKLTIPSSPFLASDGTYQSWSSEERLPGSPITLLSLFERPWRINSLYQPSAVADSNTPISHLILVMNN